MFDLLLTHEAHASFHNSNTVLDFLHTTRFYNLYRYLVNSIVASRRKELVEALVALAGTEQDRVKAEILAEALDLR